MRGWSKAKQSKPKPSQVKSRKPKTKRCNAKPKRTAKQANWQAYHKQQNTLTLAHRKNNGKLSKQY